MMRPTPMQPRIPAEFAPWLKSVCAELGLSAADQQACVAEGGLRVGDVPILLGRPTVGGDDHLLAQGLVGTLGPPAVAAQVFETVLQVQMLLLGPAMPVFGLDPATRSLLVMQVLAPRTQPAAEAAALLQALQAIAQQWRAALPHIPR